MKFCVEVVQRPVFISRWCDPDDMSLEIVEYIAYAFSVSGLQKSTIAGHLSAVKFFHRLSGAAELDTQHPLVRCALRGAARGHADAGAQQQRLRRPVSWKMLRKGLSLIPQWGVGGRALFLALGASFFFLTRASEMFAMTKLSMHAVHGLRRGGVAFFRGEVQLLLPAQWILADRVEVRFRSSKGDQLRKGAVITRTRSRAPPRELRTPYRSLRFR